MSNETLIDAEPGALHDGGDAIGEGEAIKERDLKALRAILDGAEGIRPDDAADIANCVDNTRPSVATACAARR